MLVRNYSDEIKKHLCEGYAGIGHTFAPCDAEQPPGINSYSLYLCIFEMDGSCGVGGRDQERHT